jgi:hypothetical protein
MLEQCHQHGLKTDSTEKLCFEMKNTCHHTVQVVVEVNSGVTHYVCDDPNP